MPSTNSQDRPLCATFIAVALPSVVGIGGAAALTLASIAGASFAEAFMAKDVAFELGIAANMFGIVPLLGATFCAETYGRRLAERYSAKRRLSLSA